MHTLELFNALLDHEEWADARHWAALRETPSSLANQGIFDRLQHIHMVQRGFLGLLSGRGERPAAIDGADAMQASMQKYHEDVRALLAAMPVERLTEKVEIPWFRGTLFTLHECLTQMAMHSQYHRGQNAVRLKEEGGTPPLTDFIVWVHEGRPAAAWPALSVR